MFNPQLEAELKLVGILPPEADEELQRQLRDMETVRVSKSALGKDIPDLPQDAVDRYLRARENARKLYHLEATGSKGTVDYGTLEMSIMRDLIELRQFYAVQDGIVIWRL